MFVCDIGMGLSVLGDVLEVRFVGCAGALRVLLAVVLRRFENLFYLLFAEIVVDVVAPATSWCVESLGGFANGSDVLSKRLIVKEIKVAKVVQIRVYSLKGEDASVPAGVQVCLSLVWILLLACWSILPESLALLYVLCKQLISVGRGEDIARMHIGAQRLSGGKALVPLTSLISHGLARLAIQ